MFQGVRPSSSEFESVEARLWADAPPTMPLATAPTLAKEVAAIRSETGSFRGYFEALELKLAELKKLAKGERAKPLPPLPDARARGGAKAVEAALVYLRAVVEGTSPKAHLGVALRYLKQNRAAAKAKGFQGSAEAAGEFYQYDSIIKFLEP